MTSVFLISHPEVVIDPETPVPRWHLSDIGIQRMRRFAALPLFDDLGSVWASTETKAIEAAGVLAARRGLGVHVHEGLGENDRSATGFLPPHEFERTADAFFANPETSISGWERAVDAQARIVAAVGEVLAAAPEGNLAIVAHGGVGTLLLCAMLGRPISRSMDQRSQGNYWRFDRQTREVDHAWMPIA